jgi:hypothetical protein
MSNTGLYSGHYTQISDYARLLDDVLIRLKSGGGAPSDTARQKLVKLLTDLAGGSASDLSLRTLELVLRNGGAGDKRTWSQVADALSGDDITERTVQQIERMAQVLESERAGTLARMRGVVR